MLHLLMSKMAKSDNLSSKTSIKIPKILSLENFQVGEYGEIKESRENVEVLPSAHKPCPVCLFHLAISKLHPFIIKQQSSR